MCWDVKLCELHVLHDFCSSCVNFHELLLVSRWLFVLFLARHRCLIFLKHPKIFKNILGKNFGSQMFVPFLDTGVPYISLPNSCVESWLVNWTIAKQGAALKGINHSERYFGAAGFHTLGMFWETNICYPKTNGLIKVSQYVATYCQRRVNVTLTLTLT